MKLILSLILAGVLSSASSAQPKTDKEWAGLRGPVKIVRTEVTEVTPKDGKRLEGRRLLVQVITYDDRGNVLERIDYHPDGSIAQKLVYTYDAAGHSTGYDDYTGDLKVPRKHVYVPDQNGNKAEYTIKQPDGSAGEKTVYKYDGNGNKIAEGLYHKGALISRNENTYDEKGRLISQTIYNPDGTVSSRTQTSNDPDGKLVERVRHDDEILTYRVKYKYDDKGRLAERETFGSFVESESTDGEAHITGKVVYVYKGKDLPKETVVYNPDNSLRERVVIVYDSLGNWIKKTHLVRAAKGKEQASHTEYRTIIYQVR